MRRGRAKLIVILATVLWVGLGLFSVLPAMFSVMMFDAPGSDANPATWALFASVVSFPFVCGGAVATSWAAFRAGEFAKACWCACLPVINLAVGGAASAWITLAQDGKFAG